ncbi:MAG: hypothetical protein AAFO04_05455 [Cyanobacteria bacterium J06592_8]
MQSATLFIKVMRSMTLSTMIQRWQKCKLEIVEIFEVALPSKKRRISVEVEGIEEVLEDITHRTAIGSLSKVCRWLLDEILENKGYVTLPKERMKIPDSGNRPVINEIQSEEASVSENFIRKLLADELTLADLDQTAKALKIHPSELQKIKKCDSDSNHVQSSQTF